MAITYFCDHCGAENAPGDTICHACQQPLGRTETVGTLLNERYQIINEIGAGGFGAVYLARDTHLSNQLVAVKQINLQGLSSQEIIEATDAFNREAEILNTLSHLLLPTIFDRFSDPDHWYLVMTYIDGSTLDEYVQQQQAKSLPAFVGLPLGETLEIALELCDALHYLHRQQPPVIFRDLKPGNIMRTRKGRLYLIDFGIARRFKPGQLKDTIPFGSPGFAAPEQYGRAQTTPQADIYSLGALLYCLLTGDDPSEHPFEFAPLPYSDIAGIYELNELIQSMVALNPAQRPPNIQFVQLELQHIQQINIKANQQHHIWTPPQSQVPPPSGSGQQHIFLNPTLNTQQQPHKTTRRRVLTTTLVLGGVAAFGGIIALASQLPTASNRGNTSQSTDDPQSNNTLKLTEQHGTSTLALPTSPAASWSPDLSHAAIMNSSSHQLELYSIKDGQLLQAIAVPATVERITVQWSYDNTKILLMLDTGIIQCLNVADQGKLFTLPFDASQATVATVWSAWSPDGKRLALGYSDTNGGVISLWDGLNGLQIFQQKSPDYGFLSNLVWSPDNRFIAFSDSGPDGYLSGSVEVWDTKTSQSANKFDSLVTDNINGVAAIAWSPDGNSLAILVGNIISLYDRQGHDPLQKISLTNTPLNSTLAWSPDGKRLAYLPNENLAVHDIASGQYGSENTNATLINLAWSADSTSVIAADAYNHLSSWLIS